MSKSLTIHHQDTLEPHPDTQRSRSTSGYIF